MNTTYTIKIILLFMSNYLECCVLDNTSAIGDIKQLTQKLNCQAAPWLHFKHVHRNQRLLLCYLPLIIHMPNDNIHPQCCFHDLLVFITNYQGCLTFVSREAKYSLSGNTELSLCKSSFLSFSSIELEREDSL